MGTYEYDVCEGFTVQHHGPRDWFPVVDAQWWVRDWLMCDDTCRVDVSTPRETLKRYTDPRRDHYETTDGPATWGEVRDMLAALGNSGPYGEEPVFAELTYNHENDIDDELLVAAGWVDVSEHALHRGIGSPLLRAVFASMPEHDWDDIGRVYIVAIAYGGAYGWSDTVADVYVNPNIDDDYDVAQWGVLLMAQESRPFADGASYGGSHPVWDARGGYGDAIDGLGESSGYPYGVNDDRLPMYDVSDLTGDRDDDEMPDVLDGPWLACGEAGVFAIGTDGRVHRVGASVN
jgi:hypothetical protein